MPESSEEGTLQVQLGEVAEGITCLIYDKYEWENFPCNPFPEPTEYTGEAEWVVFPWAKIGELYPHLSPEEIREQAFMLVFEFLQRIANEPPASGTG